MLHTKAVDFFNIMWNEFNLFFTMLNYFAVPTLLKFGLCFPLHVCHNFFFLCCSSFLLSFFPSLYPPSFSSCSSCFSPVLPTVHYPLIFYNPVRASHTWFHLCMLVTMFCCLPLENIISNIILHRFMNVVTNGKKGGGGRDKLRGWD